ncbi:MAG: asparagine synthase (glutamine-hydrolyzing) [Colwellia sp.]|nr:asparagine synthase (glutamine-hydrolyzing) [Colwellia sp.]
MCGICGIYNKGSEPISKETIVKMRDVMINRGPDDAGLYNAPHIGFGHRRLSIIDLSAAGNQPMSNEDRTIWVVCNGEIYNYLELQTELIERGHTFNSKSDVEVLIHGYEEWGVENLLKKINGMYAFAVWDSNKLELVLARDRLGVKPLFYLEKNGKVFFSSDIKSIWLVSEADLSINYKAMDHFLFSSCTPQEYSIFDGVKKVLPANYIIFNQAGTVINNYWYLSFALKERMNEDEYIEELKDRLALAVKRRMISDVPLGAFLSGGVDSGLVVALMAMMSDSPVKTFSIGFKEESYNELKYSRMVVEKYSTEHHEFIVEPDVMSILPEIIWSYGEPFADSSQLPTYYVAKMTREHVKVALTGDGGDESFAGYSNIAGHYFGNKYRKYLHPYLRNLILPEIVSALVSMAGRRGMISKIKTITEYGRDDFIDTLKNISASGFNYRENLFSPEFKQTLIGHDPADIFKKHALSADGVAEIDKALYIDIKTILPSDYLTKVDVATMMNSLEARSPFLDYELMEFAAKIPPSIKMKYGKQKYLLKRVASNFISRDAIYRKKSGFRIPIGYWFRSRFERLIKEILLSDRATKRGYFKPSNVKKLLEEHLAGVSDHTSYLWSLICLELWHLMFIDKVITRNTELN